LFFVVKREIDILSKNKSIIYDAKQCQPIRQSDGHTLFEPISVSIREGEWITLIGHNGSGKSTLARFIAGHQRAELAINGRENRFNQEPFPIITQLTSQYLLGSTPFADLIICYEQYGQASKDKSIEVEVDELLATLRLQHLKHVPMNQLSGGEKQLVAIAGAMLMATQLTVLDEVTSMLSEDNKWHVCSLIRALAQSHGIAVLWITQQLDELQANDTVWVMDKLELVYDGLAGQLFTSVEGEASEARKRSLEVPWSVRKSLELGLQAEQLQFNPYALAEGVKRNARTST